MADINMLQKNLGYTFKDISLLEKALIHPSFLNEKNVERIYSNQRLEFFGDSVLSLAVSEYIFTHLTSFPEGKLTELRAKVVCEDSLAKMANRLNVGEFLMLGRGERMSGGGGRPSTLSDAMEAIIAAIYLDGGFEKAKEFVLSMLMEDIDAFAKSDEIVMNYKSHLQEYAQSIGYSVRYELLDEYGPDHAKTFKVCALVGDRRYSEGEGTSKKKAEQEAAKIAYNEIKKNL